MNEIFVGLLKTVFGAIGSDPKRLSVALSLGLVMKAIAQFLASYEPDNKTYQALTSIDVLYFVALAFFVLFIPLLFSGRDELDKDISKLTELMNNSNLNDMDKRILTRGLIKSYINRTSPPELRQKNLKSRERPDVYDKSPGKAPYDG